MVEVETMREKDFCLLCGFDVLMTIDGNCPECEKKAEARKDNEKYCFRCGEKCIKNSEGNNLCPVCSLE